MTGSLFTPPPDKPSIVRLYDEANKPYTDADFRRSIAMWRLHLERVRRRKPASFNVRDADAQICEQDGGES